MRFELAGLDVTGAAPAAFTPAPEAALLPDGEALSVEVVDHGEDVLTDEQALAESAAITAALAMARLAARVGRRHVRAIAQPMDIPRINPPF